MKEIAAESIILPLQKAIEHALVNVEKNVCNLLENAVKTERSPLSKWAMQKIILNNICASKTNTFACQDCGVAVLFVSVGQDVGIKGSITDALNKGVEMGYKAARKSVANSIDRINTATNTPAIIHYDIVSGDKITIKYLAKGAGSENMSAVYMLTPSMGEKGIIDSVVSCVKNAGANPCPPIILGIGIGGTMEKCALLSKLALTRETGTPSKDGAVATLEKKILEAVNSTRIGAQGYGGDTTCLAVHIESFPTHIGMLPVAVNIQCHSVRHATIII